MPTPTALLLALVLLFTPSAFADSPAPSPSQPVNHPGDPKLLQYRNQIDSLDRQIVTLLNQRAALVERIGNLKKQTNAPVAAPAREQQVIQQAIEAGKSGPLPAARLRRIYETILEEMRNWEASGK